MKQLAFTVSEYLGVGVVLELPPHEAVEGVPGNVRQIPAYGPDVAEHKRLAERAAGVLYKL